MRPTATGVDELDVEERVVALLDRVLSLAYRDRRARARAPRLPSATRSGGCREGAGSRRGWRSV